MNHFLLRLTVSASFTALLSATCLGQTWTKESLANLFAAVAADERLVAECEDAQRKEQIKKFGNPLRKISGHCWEGCPVIVPKPHYPSEARRLRISGQVVVETVVDEKGNVIFAKAVKGKSFLRREALVAAYNSRYQPKITCGSKPIKFRWTIKYNFFPSM